MRKLKKWLLLLGTVLVVAGAAMLPPRLSQARDQAFFHQVNVEAVEDTLFSPVNDLVSRIKFFAKWELNVDASSVDTSLGFSQEILPQDLSKTHDSSLVAHSNDLEQRALDAIYNLTEAIPQLEPLLPAMPGVEGTRLTIFDWDTSETAFFLQFIWMDQQGLRLLITMDETMEKVISLVIPMPQLSEWEEEIGEKTREEISEEIMQAFLGYLGLTREDLYQATEDVDGIAVNTDADITYCISLNDDMLIIEPLAILPGGSVDSSHSRIGVDQSVDQDGNPLTVIVERNDADLMQNP